VIKADIQLLYEYDRWANGRVLKAVSKLSQEDFTRDLRGGFGSVRDILVHIVGSEWAWLVYWKQPSPRSAFLTDLWTQEETLFHRNAFGDLATIQLKWTEVEKEQVKFVNQLTEESLLRMLPVEESEISLGHLMQHLANHSTYHRGQVAVMMRQLSAEPLATDFAMFLLETRSGRVAAAD
jgi:uncharacterized damage-inducible protein DinB